VLKGGFFVGLHQPSDAKHFGKSCISVKRLAARKGNFEVHDWIMDSGAFTEIKQHGEHRMSPSEYGRLIDRWSQCGRLLAAVAQDFMCEPAMLKATGLTVFDHQRLTIERYDALLACSPVAYVMPVLQGYEPTEYEHHLRQYGSRLDRGAWVGVGSVCKRNGDPQQIVNVLAMLKEARPDIRLHGFGIKITSLKSGAVRELLHTADSMAWSFSARRQGA
jgi:hypothetical protein